MAAASAAAAALGGAIPAMAQEFGGRPLVVGDRFEKKYGKVRLLPEQDNISDSQVALSEKRHINIRKNTPKIPPVRI